MIFEEPSSWMVFNWFIPIPSKSAEHAATQKIYIFDCEFVSGPGPESH